MKQLDRFPLCSKCGVVLFTDGVRRGLNIYCSWCAQDISEDEAKDLAIAATCLDGMAAPRTMPSREFLIRQAVLNAAAESYPATVRLRGAAECLRRYNMQEGDDGTILHGAILRHFNLLVSQYA